MDALQNVNWPEKMENLKKKMEFPLLGFDTAIHRKTLWRHHGETFFGTRFLPKIHFSTLHPMSRLIPSTAPQPLFSAETM